MSYYGGGYGGQGAGGNGGMSGNPYYGNNYGQGYPSQPQQHQQQPGQQAGNPTAPAGNAYGYGGNVQQWQQQQQQPTQQQPPQQSVQPQQQTQQQQASMQPNFFNPAAAATMMSVAAQSGLSNDAMFDLAMTGGQTFLKSSTARMIPGLESSMQMLRVYFAVDNHYVKRKIQKVLFPFLSKQWQRQPSMVSKNPNDLHPFALPSADENAPDLYLPSMTLITYVLLCALCYGTAGKFSPEVLPDVTTKCFVTQIMEVLAIRFGFYMMQAPIAFLDLFSYTGYKYLGLCVNMLAGLALANFGFGSRAYYIFFLWTASAASYFVLKTMANNIPMEVAATGPKREIMVVVFAASQAVTMWFVSQTKFLN